ncbi:MAG: tRNA (adenosine(37)-N6)-dimethylallyltransferase MiaA [Clostridia bacterium]|nr:tRNA (adenosine(37)-N6)-dimethylallyltransferase MiaA [Clostridia bacterium]
MRQVLVICGPTASGKTALAVECAKRFETSIISADSQLVYKGLDIGTAKPTEEEMRGITHYLIDVVDPFCEFSVSDYRNMAKPVVDGLISEGKVPVICGGTGFYVNSILFDFSYGSVPKDEDVRKKYEEIKAEKGSEYLYSLLVSVDPESAKTLHPNDIKRIIRALEIYDVSGQKKSDLNDGTTALYDYLAVAINFPRDVLYERINARVDDMMQKGLVDEVKGLIADGYGECMCMKAIGYKEVAEGLKNNWDSTTMRDIIAQNTRRFAKRQIAFFKKLPGLVWLNQEEATAERIEDLMNA